MSYLGELIEHYPDAVRHRLVADCLDWDLITPALVEWGTLAEHGFLQHGALRVLCEVIYVMGYNRGAKERPLPKFIVSEESDSERQR